MASLESNKVTGVSVVSNATDAANKAYVDSVLGAGSGIPSASGYSGNFLLAYPGVSYWIMRTLGLSVGVASPTKVYYGNNKYVLGAEYGVIYSSTDAITWVNTTTSLSNNISSGAYGAGLYVAGSGAGVLSPTPYVVSTDAISWVRRTAGVYGQTINDIVYGNNLFVAVTGATSDGSIRFSTDGIVWRSRTSPYGNSIPLNRAGFGNNLYLAAGTGRLCTSTDSIVWIARTVGFTVGCRGLTYGNGVYVASCDSGVLSTSTDGISWVLRTSGAGSLDHNEVAFGDNTFVVTVTTQNIRTSTDAIVWTQRTATGGTYTDVAYANKSFIAVSNANNVATSLTTQTYWEPINTSTASSTDPVSYKGSQEFDSSGTFVIPPTATQFYIEVVGAGAGGRSGNPYSSGAVGPGAGGGAGSYNAWLISRGELGNATTMTVSVGAGGLGGNNRGMDISTDGIVWVANAKGTTISDIVCLGYGNNIYLSGGSGGSLGRSEGGQVWRAIESGTTSGIFGLGYGNGIYLFNTNSGLVRASTDSIIWTTRTVPSGTDALYSPSYLNGNYYLVGGVSNTRSVIQTSTDTITWVLRTAGVNQLVYGIAYGNNTFVASTFSVNTRASTDGITWVARTGSFGGGHGTFVTFLVDQFYMVSGGALLASTDSITWILRTTSFGNNTTQITYGSGLYAAVGNAGRIATSTDAVVWTRRTNQFKGSNVNCVTYGGVFIAGGVIAGNGGTGASSSVSWTGNTATGTATYTLTSNAGQGVADTSMTGGSGGAAAATVFNPLIAVAGQAGGTASTISGPGANSIPSISYQISGGGSGSLNTFVAGSGTSYYYGNTYTNAGNATGGGGGDGVPVSYTGGAGGGGGGGGAVGNGINSWYLRTAAFGATGINALTFGNNLYVAGGDSGTLSTSTDSLVWTLRTSGLGASNIDGLNFGNNIYVAVGAGNLRASTDAINWVARTTSYTTAALREVLYADGLYICCGAGARLATSTDTITWTPRTSAAGTISLGALAFYNGLYLATGGNVITVSTNGVIWTLRTMGSGSGGTASSASAGANFYVVGGGTSGSFSYLNSSTDTIVWQLRTARQGVGGRPIYALLFGGGIFVASSSSGDLVTSTDSIVWSGRNSYTQATLQALSYGNDTYLVGGSGGYIGTASGTSQYKAGPGGNGTRGGGGGGGGYSSQLPDYGVGGDGGNGYVRITWW